MAEEKTQFKDVLGSFGIDRGDLTTSNLPGFGMQLLDAFTPNALVKFLRENFGIESTEEEAQRLMEEQGFETGGRVGLQNGGPPFGGPITTPETPTSTTNYEDILKRIQQTYPTDSQQTISRPGPQAEALQSVFAPTLAQFLGRPMSPTGGTNVFGQQFGSFLPQQQAQNVLQQQQIQQALNQAGLGAAQFDPTTGGLTGVTGTGTGVAGFQPFLDQATTTADRASQEAVAGQDAGLQQLQNAATQANLAGLAAIAGQDAGAGGVSAAQNIADQLQAAATAGQDRAQPFLDRAAQLSAPGAVEEFMSPFQQAKN